MPVTIESRKRSRNASDSAIEPTPKSAPTAFGAALQKVLSRDLHVPSQGSAVLAKRHTTAQKAEATERAAALALRLKRSLRRSEVRSRNSLPGVLDKTKERHLRRVATKGVIALFNAVARHQHAAEQAVDEPAESGDRLKSFMASKASFLNILQDNVRRVGDVESGGRLAPKQREEGKGGAMWLSEKFVEQSGSAKGGRRAREAEDKHREVMGGGVGGLLDGGEEF